jgi:hypothetical protein
MIHNGPHQPSALHTSRAHHGNNFLFGHATPPIKMFKQVAGKAAARSATRRIMSVTSADGREPVSAPCLKGEA